MKRIGITALLSATILLSVMTAYASNTTTLSDESGRNPSSEIVIEEKYDALPTASKVIVNGNEISFDAYNINGNNFFKLRDIAMAFNGTSQQFNVTWLSSVNVISMNLRQSYIPVGGELNQGDGKVKIARRTGVDVSIEECIYNFDIYNINGNNYFKLRELGKLLNFYVGWDEVNNCVIINTEEPYID